MPKYRVEVYMVSKEEFSVAAPSRKDAIKYALDGANISYRLPTFCSRWAQIVEVVKSLPGNETP